MFSSCLEPYQDISIVLLQLTNIRSDLNNWISLSSQWIPKQHDCCSPPATGIPDVPHTLQFWLSLCMKSSWLGSTTSVSFFLSMRTCCSSMAVIMATRDCCQTETQLWVVISCFNSLQGRFSERNGLIPTRDKLAKISSSRFIHTEHLGMWVWITRWKAAVVHVIS